jgi:3-hydroxyisobutyrate dehydrogenase-like beta-hydroxyacid dehydrogenase
MDVGLIGVGLMGHGIAYNLREQGHFPLTLLDHPGNQPVDDLIELGARLAPTGSAVAAGSDVIILCVTGSPQVEDVLTREDGVLAGLRPGTVVIDCSTSLPESTLKMAEQVKAAGGAFLDAPMTRLAQHARAGTLNILVGGDAADLARVRPVLDAFTESIEHVGPVGFGHRMKLLHNYVSIGFMALLGEAAAQAAQAGVDPEIFVDILAKGGGGGMALERLSPHILTGDGSNVPFVIANAIKDIDYYRAMVKTSVASTVIADGVSAAISTVIEDGHDQAYISELSRLFRAK